MQIPPIDKNLAVRPLTAELASMAPNRVVPVAPVNPTTPTAPKPESPEGVVNRVGQSATAAQDEAGLYTGASDPAQQGLQEATPKDWTERKPEPEKEKVQDPPPEPLYKMLIEHLRSMWEASAMAVQVQQDVRKELNPLLQNPADGPTKGNLMNEALTYSPNKIYRNDKSNASTKSGSSEP